MTAMLAGTAHLGRLALAAAVLAATPASALDLGSLPALPQLAACPEYGAGFARVPGSATCIRVSGRVAAGADIGSRHAAAPTPPVAGRLAIDSRTDTDYGPARAFVRFGAGRR